MGTGSYLAVRYLLALQLSGKGSVFVLAVQYPLALQLSGKGLVFVLAVQCPLALQLSGKGSVSTCPTAIRQGFSTCFGSSVFTVGQGVCAGCPTAIRQLFYQQLFCKEAISQLDRAAQFENLEAISSDHSRYTDSCRTSSILSCELFLLKMTDIKDGYKYLEI